MYSQKVIWEHREVSLGALIRKTNKRGVTPSRPRDLGAEREKPGVCHKCRTNPLARPVLCLCKLQFDRDYLMSEGILGRYSLYPIAIIIANSISSSNR